MTQTPMWPSFVLMKSQYAYLPDHWRAETCTLRPPVVHGRGQRFSVVFEASDEDTAMKIGTEKLMEAYVSAHPENCARTDLEAGLSGVRG